MQALCKDWTEGSPPVFAVVDGLGAWNGDNELCVTQQGQTPMIAAWTTTSQWTQLGSPYLWWTGPDDAAVLAALVQWGHGAKLLGGSAKVGVLAGDRTSDQNALKQDLLPDLKKIGVTPTVVTVAAGNNSTATTNSDVQLAVERFKAAGVTSVIPLVPEPAFFPYVGAETSQQYFPRLLLSDYEQSIGLGLGLIPIPYEKALDGQEGVTTETLGGFDDARPESKGGYDAGRPGLLPVLARCLPEAAEGSRELLHRGAGTRGDVVRRHPALRGGRHQRGVGPQSQDLRDRDVQDHQLPRQHLAGVDLRSDQVLRSHPIPGRQAPQQRAALVPVQAEDEPQAPGHLLGDGAALQAAAAHERLLSG